MTRTVMKLFDLSGKTALVTGGSRGLGLQMAQALGEAGARIMLSSRNAEDLKASVATLRAAGMECDWIAADCSKEGDIRALADETIRRLGHVDVLLNNAGISMNNPSLELTGEEWSRAIDIDLSGVWYCSQAAAKRMIAQGGGAILSTSSMWGVSTAPGRLA